MRYGKKRFIREGENRRTFTRPGTSRSEDIDLSSVRILHSGVDTVRQLYHGKPTREFDALEYTYLNSHGAHVMVAGEQWKLGSGRDGGYRLLLKNTNLGLIILYGQSHARRKDRETGEIIALEHGSHLKIECSPHWLYERTPQEAQRIMDAIAAELLEDAKHNGCALHLCTDVQGWTPPTRDDFGRRFVSRARRNFAVHGGDDVADFDFSGFSISYNQMETVTFGSAAGHQFQLYNKTLAATRADMIQFWEKVWRNKTGDDWETLYNSDELVYRFEHRFHQSVINQFVGTRDESTGKVLTEEDVNNYAALSNHLQGLWAYGLTNHRLQHSTHYIDPMWQLLIEDATFTPPGGNFLYKRTYKKAGKGGAERNVMGVMGNMLSLLVRRGFRARVAWKRIMKMPIWPDIEGYYRNRGLSPGQMWDEFERKFKDRQFEMVISA